MGYVVEQLVESQRYKAKVAVSIPHSVTGIFY
jgi:hypothetical protein